MAEIKKINTELQPLDKLLDTSGDAGTSGQVLSSTGSGTNWVAPGGSGTVTGSGTATYIPIWTSSTALGDSVVFQTGTNRLDALVDTLELSNDWIIQSTDGSYWQRIRTEDATPETTNAFNFETRNGSGDFINHMTILNSGNVGIGTGSPSFQLSIENHATTTSTATLEIDGKRTNGTDGPVGEMIFSNNGDTFATVAGFRDGADNKGSLQFQTQDSTFATRMTISSEGNVGIGIAPLAPLQVKTATDLNFTVTANGTSDVRINAVNDAVDATVPLEFNATNYEFLGTGGTTFAGSITTNLSSAGTYFTGGSGGVRQLSITSGTNISAHALHTFNIASSNGKYEFDVNGTTELSLDSSSAAFVGNITTLAKVGIGTITPQAFTRLDVRSGNVNGNHAIAGYGYNGVGGAAILGHGFATDNTHAGSSTGIRGISNGSRTVTGSINIGGQFTASGAVSNYAIITTAGNVGINNTTPTFALDVIGTARVSGNTEFPTQSTTDDSTKVATTAFVKNILAEQPAGLTFLGDWNADTNSPTLVSGGGELADGAATSVAANKLNDTNATFQSDSITVNADRVRVVQANGNIAFSVITTVNSNTQLTLTDDIATTVGDTYIVEKSPFLSPEGGYYIVGTSGDEDLNGITDWVAGDWVLIATTNVFQKIDNTSILSGAGTENKVTQWASSSGDPSVTLASGPITFSGSDSTFAQDITARIGTFKSPDATTSTLMNLTCSDGTNAATFRTTSSGNVFIIKSQNSGTLSFDSTSSTFAGNVTLESASPVLKIDATDTGNPEIYFTRLTSDDQNAKIILGTNQLRFENSGDPDGTFLFQGRAAGAGSLSDFLKIEDTGITAPGATFLGAAASGVALVTIENNSGSTATSYGLLVKGGGDSSSGKTFEVRDDSGNTDLIVKGNGTVGIGTTTLAADSILTIGTTASTGLTLLSVSNAGESFLNFADSDDINVGRIYYGHGDNAMRFRTNDGLRMIIDSSGNVGIDTVPETGMVTYVKQLRIGEQSALQGHADGVGADSFTCVTTNFFFSTSGSVFINGTVAAPGFANKYQQQTGDHTFSCSTASGVAGGAITERIQMVIKQNGNVGIGATIPATILHVADANAVVRIEATTNGQNCSTWYKANGNNQWETGCNIGAGTDYQIYDRLNSASRMVVGHNGNVTIPGNVGIGTISPNKTLELGYSNTEQNVLLNGLPGGAAGTGILVFNTDTSTTSPFANIDFRAGNADARIAIQRAGDNSSNFHFITDNANTFGTKMFLKHNGQFGLGTVSPVKNIELSYSNSSTDVIGNLAGAGTGGGVLLRNIAGTGYANVDFRVNDADGRIAYKWEASNTGNFHFITDNAGTVDTKMFIKHSGNVGIGTITPASKLEVNGNVTISEKIIHAGDTDTFLKFNSGGWEFQSSGGPTTDISASGGVTSIYGKGTEAIQVGSSQIANFLGPIYATNSLTAALNPIAASGGTKGLPAYSFISDTNTGMYSDTADQLEFVTGGDIGMVIDSSSNVGIGNTNPGNQLEVTGIIEATVGDTGGFAYGANPASKQGLMISVSNTGGDAFSGAGRIENTSTTNSSSAVLVLRQTNSASFSTITQYRQGSGTQGNLVGFVRVTTTNTIFSTSGSDERLKKNITNWTDDTLGKFKALQPKKFRYKIQDASEEKTTGFIAQNEVANFPEAYVLNKENEEDDAMYSFNPMGMTTHLMKGMKDLIEKVEALEKQVEDLKSKI